MAEAEYACSNFSKCPSCHGKKTSFALVDGPTYSGPMVITCSTCNGAGEVSATVERWIMIGVAHRRWRVAQEEGQRECAKRLGISPTELSAMEAGRADPERLRTASGAAEKHGPEK